MKKITFAAAAAALTCSTVFGNWAGNARYAASNREAPKGAVVLYGDSITDGWPRIRPAFFKDNGFIGRGIGGQTTAQMLCRFRRDVIELKPEAVVVLAGINDMAENNGPIEARDVLGNIKSMHELARANGIRFVLCSVTPAAAFSWRKTITDAAERIRNLNILLKQYAEANNILWIDYYSKLEDGKGGMRKGLANDGLHPNANGYVIMEKVLLDALIRQGGRSASLNTEAQRL